MLKKIKKNLMQFFKNRIYGSKIIQSILLTAVALFKSLHLKLKKSFSFILSNMTLPKTRVFRIFSQVVKVRGYLSNRKQKILMVSVGAFFVFNLFLFNSIGGQFLSQTTLQSSGVIKTLGVAAYQDSNCITQSSNINWGTISPGASIPKTIYLRNEGNSDLTLSLQTANWSPTNAPNYLTLSWNYIGQTIRPNQVVPIVLTLSVSQNINGINSFNYEIIILGTS